MTTSILSDNSTPWVLSSQRPSKLWKVEWTAYKFTEALMNSTKKHLHFLRAHIISSNVLFALYNETETFSLIEDRCRHSLTHISHTTWDNNTTTGRDSSPPGRSGGDKNKRSVGMYDGTDVHVDWVLEQRTRWNTCVLPKKQEMTLRPSIPYFNTFTLWCLYGGYSNWEVFEISCSIFK